MLLLLLPAVRPLQRQLLQLRIRELATVAGEQQCGAISSTLHRALVAQTQRAQMLREGEAAHTNTATVQLSQTQQLGQSGSDCVREHDILLYAPPLQVCFC